MSELALPGPGSGDGAADLRRGLLVSTTVLTGRCLRLARRNVDALLTALLLPVLIMLLFVYLFGGAIRTGTAHYVTYVVPGVLMLCAGFGSGATAVPVCQDLSAGMVDRFRSQDVSGTAILTGHVVASLVRNGISAVLVLGVALLIGFRPQAGVLGWIGAAGMMLLFVLAMSWFSAALGVLVRSPEAANGFTFITMFITYPSSAFVPISTMPTWLQGFARTQPVTPVTETVRGLLLGQPVGPHPVAAVAWMLGITACSMLAAGLLFRRRIR